MKRHHKTNVLITVDTEFSIGGHFDNRNLKPVSADRHIYCRVNGKDYGINLIMDILEEYNLKGIFFVETESRFYFGKDEICSIIKDIEERGHEIQLHIHPNYRSFIHGKRVADNMSKYSQQEQTDIIGSAQMFLSSCGIQDILAFRSGGFYSNLDTNRALQNNHIKYASNYNLAFPNCGYIERYPLRNDIFRVESIFELPITCYREYPLRKEWNCFQLSAASFREIKAGLDHYHSRNCQVVTFLTHSFEFVQAQDVQFSRIRPIKLYIKRFHNICQHLAVNSEKYNVVTIGELDRLVSGGEVEIPETRVTFFESSLFSTTTRYMENCVLSRAQI
jgi:hypothetical protein